jgi:fatty acid kinase fatty acid binding subunit
MIQIFTDTTSSLTLEEYEKYGIHPIPILINQGEVSQQELFDLKYEEFFRNQRAGVRYTTSQPAPLTYLEAFQSVIAAGDEIICIVFSSGISGTYNTLCITAQMLNTDKITVIDSRLSGFGQSYMAVKAREMAASGATRVEITDYLEALHARSQIYFLVESLAYLHAGGRLSGAQALIGSIIQIKPIIWFEPNGKMSAFEKVRTNKAAKARLIELTTERATLGIQALALHYGDNKVEAVEYAQEIEDAVGIQPLLIPISPVLCVHTGPDILGICTVTKN